MANQTAQDPIEGAAHGVQSLADVVELNPNEQNVVRSSDGALLQRQSSTDQNSAHQSKGQPLTIEILDMAMSKATEIGVQFGNVTEDEFMGILPKPGEIW